MGTVYQVCDIKNNCEYTIKMIDLQKYSDVDKAAGEVDKEVYLLELFNKHNIGAKFYCRWTCDNVAFIVTEKWDGALPPDTRLSDKLKLQYIN